MCDSLLNSILSKDTHNRGRIIKYDHIMCGDCNISNSIENDFTKLNNVLKSSDSKDWTYIRCTICNEVKKYKEKTSMENFVENDKLYLICDDCVPKNTKICGCGECKREITHFNNKYILNMNCSVTKIDWCWICVKNFPDNEIKNHIKNHYENLEDKLLYEAYLSSAYNSEEDLLLYNVPERFRTEQLVYSFIKSFDINRYYFLDKDQTEDECLKWVYNDTRAIVYIKNKTQKIIEYVLKTSPYLYVYIENLTEKDLIKLLTYRVSLFKKFENQSFAICKAALDIDWACMSYIKDQTEEICKYVLSGDGTDDKHNAFKYIRNKTKELCDIALNIDPMLLEYVDECFQDSDQCMKAVKKDFNCWIFVADKTDDIIREVIKKYNKLSNYFSIDYNRFYLYTSYINQCHKNLKWIKDQTEELCLYAISINVNSFEYVKNKTPKICDLVLSKNIEMIKFITEEDNISDEIFIKFIKTNYKVLKYIKIKTYKICEEALFWDYRAVEFIDINENELIMYAINCNPKAISYIKNPSEDVIYEAVKVAEVYEKYIADNINFDSLSEKLIMNILRISGLYIQHIKNQTEKLCQIAIYSDALSLQFINNKTDILEKQSIMLNPKAIQFVRKQNTKIVSHCFDISSNINHNIYGIIIFIDKKYITRKIVTFHKIRLDFMCNDMTIKDILLMNEDNDDNDDTEDYKIYTEDYNIYIY